VDSFINKYGKEKFLELLKNKKLDKDLNKIQ
jgi:hypothetical protein